MKRLLRTLPPFAVAILLTTCDGFGPDDNALIAGLPRELSIAEGKLIQADNRFAFKLFREINEQAGDSNVFISPLSVAMALGMTYNGAAGSTKEAMEETLGLEGTTLQEINQSYRDLIDLLLNLDHRVEFTLANSIWYRDTWTFSSEFLETTRTYFDAEVTALDFDSPQAGRTINDWVDEKTNGKIQEIVPQQIPIDIIMYLINAIYFKADWAAQFDKSLTADGPFTLKDGSQITAKMMWHDEPARVWRYRGQGISVVDVPYGGRAFSMTIVIPDTPAAIDSIGATLTREQWDLWIAGLDSAGLVISMPKFTIEYEISLNDALDSLGMGVAFQPYVADFTRMCCQPGDIYIDSVKHKAFVEVNEEGTEAAAATSVGIAYVSAGPSSLVIDRPFVFVIREKFSGTILFMGKVMDPTAG
jgi:serine protease inhibitor